MFESDILTILFPAVTAAVLSALLVPVVRRIALSVGAVDEPGVRKVHTASIPRLGGVAVIAALVLTAAMIYGFLRSSEWTLDSRLVISVGIGALPVFIVSLLDDLRSFPWGSKLVVHLTGAGLAVYGGIRLEPVIQVLGVPIEIGWLAVPLSLLWIVGLTNAFNIVDGLDGLSAGLALISALSLGAVSLVMQRYEMAIAAFTVTGAIFGFLPYNLHPAKIFLGDSGSATLGFILASLALMSTSTMNAGLAVALPVVVLGLPIAEAVVSVLRRIVLRLEGGTGGILDADRRHFHHRLLDLGLTHQKAVLVLYSVGILFALAGLSSLLLSYQSSAILLSSLFIAAVIALHRLKYDEFAFLRRGTVLKAYDVPMLNKGFVVIFVDIIVAIASIWISIGLKWDDWGLVIYGDLAEEMLVWFPATAVALFWLFRVYRGAWRLAGVEDLVRSSAAALGTAVAGAAVTIWISTVPPPSSFFVLYGMVFMLLVNVTRLSYRFLSLWTDWLQSAGRPTLIYGAGIGGVTALREILGNRGVDLRPLGFIDDDPAKRGRRIRGVPVLGTSEDIGELLRSGTATVVVISSFKIPPPKIAILHETCVLYDVEMLRFALRFETEVIPGPPDHEADDSESVIVDMARVSN